MFLWSDHNHNHFRSLVAVVMQHALPACLGLEEAARIFWWRVSLVKQLDLLQRFFQVNVLHMHIVR